MLTVYASIFVLITTQFSIGLCDSYENETETGEYVTLMLELELKLLRNYNRKVRPMENTTVVDVYPVIRHIENVNEAEQAMVMQGSLFMTWNDPRLSWDPSEFYNVDQTTIHAWYIWKPDIVLYNSGRSTDNMASYEDYYAKVYSDGTVFYLPSFTYVALCTFDFSAYPNDEQSCRLILGSWGSTMDAIELRVFSDRPGIQLAFNESKPVISGWKLHDTSTNISYWDGAAMNRSYEKPDVSRQMVYFVEFNVWLIIRRHAIYFGVVVLLPAVMTSFFTLVSFWTVSTSLGIVLLLISMMIQAVFSDDLLETMPTSGGTIPKIVYYMAINLLLTTLAIAFLLIFKTIANLDETVQPIPLALNALVDGRNRVNSLITGQLAFQRHHDEEDPDPEASQDKSAPEEVGESSSSVKSKKTNWIQVADVLNVVCFALYTIIYIICMCVLLT